jgi:putative DNA modification/repair radical SAM protein
MAQLNLTRKLEILSDAAKYDASCASSGGERRSSRSGRGVGAVTGRSGVCHAYTPDGRCISLLKILLTNFCVYDCAYCVNRISSNTPRARFSVDEVVALTLDFYKRNYVEGLFLSSGVIQSADYTQEQLNCVAKTLRDQHDFRGYIHLKLIAGASPELAQTAGLYADRLSVNIELPKDESLVRLAPEKTPASIRQSMGRVRFGIETAKDFSHRKTPAPKFAGAGQSTQMIVGADDASDADIIGRADSLYAAYGLKRVYYSAFSPIPDTSSVLPSTRPHLMREHRLYQADWLMRQYGFGQAEILDGQDGGMLDLELDPKLAWALRHRGQFPVDVNSADKERLLRIPGLGVRSVKRVLALRRTHRITLEDLRSLTGSIKTLKAFVVCADWRPTSLSDEAGLEAKFRTAPRRGPVQLSLF